MEAASDMSHEKSERVERIGDGDEERRRQWQRKSRTHLSGKRPGNSGIIGLKSGIDCDDM